MFKRFGGGPKCAVCQKSVFFNEKVTFSGKAYHKFCFKCTECAKPLQLGNQTEHKGNPYCKQCYGKKYGTKGYGFGSTLNETGYRPGGRPISVSSMIKPTHKGRHVSTRIDKSASNTKSAMSTRPSTIDENSTSTSSSKHVSTRKISKRSSKRNSKSEHVSKKSSSTSSDRKSKRTSSSRASSKRKSNLKSSSMTKEFKGTKWFVGNATAEDGVITIDVASMAHTVYIYRSVGATIVVNGKCNSIAIDACVKSKVLFDSVLATTEISNCKSMQVQVKEFAPSVSIDNTDGCLLYLSTLCVTNPDFSIIAAKSSEMNISFPDPTSPDQDYMELPLPEQFKYSIDTKGEEPEIAAQESDLYSS